MFVDSHDNIVISTDAEHFVALLGVNDMIVIHTRDVTMICPKSEAQRVKELVGKVREKFGDRFQ
jgi:mannose-1-phosphate guanylyltransferase